jgi:aspartyl-tRNA(Asn)/glutamyl-tRNA(Gln) amidotransferase subunit B
VDYNRAGTPLLEVVSEPAMRSADEAMAYVRALRTLVMHLDVCDGNMQEGSLRADANVSVRKKGDPELGQRTELKNLNSVRFLGQAIEDEARRQVRELQEGRPIVQETRLWDADKKESRSMRGKEDAHDYRYFPDPDLLPIVISEEELARAQAALPELPRARAARYADEVGLKPTDARMLAGDKALAAYFEQALAAHGNARALANWIVHEGAMTEGVSALALAQLVKLIDDGTITGKIAKQVFAELATGPSDDPAQIVADKGWKVERDSGALGALIDELIASNDKQVAQYRAGKGRVLGFFVGQVMKKTQGQADPAAVNRLIKDKLGEPGES